MGGIGEWGGNNPQADIDPDTQTELGPRFPIYRDSSDFHLNKVLVGNVQRNNYFKQLSKFTTFKQVVDQIYYQVEFITPWEPGSHSNKSAGGMCSQVNYCACERACAQRVFVDLPPATRINIRVPDASTHMLIAYSILFPPNRSHVGRSPPGHKVEVHFQCPV